MASSDWKGWIDGLFGKSRRRVRRADRRVKPRLVEMEDRITPRTFVVTNVLDSGFDVNGGFSLRQAMRDANDNPGHDRIVFNIPTNPSQPAVFSIRLATALPELTDPAGVSIDATTQPGFDELGRRPVIEITGSFSNPQFDTDSGFELSPNSGNNLIRGFIINSFPLAGISLNNSDNNIIVGNWIGVNINGFNNPDLAPTDENFDFLNEDQTPNGKYQIVVREGSSGNVIGGTVDLNGDALFDAGGDAVGGTIEENRNIISGSAENNPFGTAPVGQATGPGVRIQGLGTANNLVQGNLIGTTVDTSVPLPNVNGVEIFSDAYFNYVGHPFLPEQENLITGNLLEGVRVGPTPYPLGDLPGPLPDAYDTYNADYFRARVQGVGNPNYPVLDVAVRDARTDGETEFDLADEIGFGTAGYQIFLQGSGFESVTDVFIGDEEAVFEISDNGTLIVTVPPDAAIGLQSLRVVSPSGVFNSADEGAFFRVLPSPDPAFNTTVPYTDRFGSPIIGALAGEQIRLKGFGFLGTTDVFVGGIPVTDFEVIDDQTLDVVIPPSVDPGNVTALVINASTAVAESAAEAFPLEVFPPGDPTVRNLSVTSGPFGQRLTIFGENLLGATDVIFNGVPATDFTIDQETNGARIFVEVPDGAASGPVTVVTNAGLAVSPEFFTVIDSPSPRVFSFDPGGVEGDLIGITGEGFTGTRQVQFNGLPAPSFRVINDRRIEVSVPTGATTGPLTVVTPGGEATTREVFGEPGDIVDPRIDVFTVQPNPLDVSFVINEADGAPLNLPFQGLENGLIDGDLDLNQYVEQNEIQFTDFGPASRAQPEVTFDQRLEGPAGSYVAVSIDNGFFARAVHFVQPETESIATVFPYDDIDNPRGFIYARSRSVGNEAERIFVPVPAGAALGENIIIVETPGAPPATTNPPLRDWNFFPENLPNGRRFTTSEITLYPPGRPDDPNFPTPPPGALSANVPYEDTDPTILFPGAVVYGERFFVTPSPRATVESAMDNTPGDTFSAGTRGYGAGSDNEAHDLSTFFAQSLPGVVRLTGTGFTSTTGLSIGGVEVDDWFVESDTQMYFVVPPTAPLGEQLIRIRTPDSAGIEDDLDGEFISESTATYNVLAGQQPIFQNAAIVSPALGQIPGTYINFSGTNLSQATAVTMGGVPVREWEVLSDNEIRFQTPGIGPVLPPDMGAPQAFPITVFTPAGSATSFPFTLFPPSKNIITLNPPGRPTLFDPTQAPFGLVQFPANGKFVGDWVGINGFPGKSDFPNIVVNGSVAFTAPGGRVAATELTALTENIMVVRIPEVNPITGNIELTLGNRKVTTPNITINDQGDPAIFFFDAKNSQAINAQVGPNSISGNGPGAQSQAIDFFTGLTTDTEPLYFPPQGNDLLDDDTESYNPITDHGGPNRDQNYPLLQVGQSSIDRTSFPTSLVSQPFREYRIDYYINDQAAFDDNNRILDTYIGTIFIQTDDQGFGSGEFILKGDGPVEAPLPLGTQVTAVATDLTPGTRTSIRRAVIFSSVPEGDGTSRVSISQAVDPSTGGITGGVFLDANGNGLLDPEEITGAGQEGVLVELDLDDDGTVEATMVTDAEGNYAFTQATLPQGLGLPNGTHRVTEVVPDGFVAIDPEGGTQLVTIIQGEVVPGVNFLNGEAPPPPPDEGDPEANDDTFAVPADSADNFLDVLANDTDPDGDLITVTGVGAAANGTASVAADGAGVEYDPAPGFTGDDTFTYTIVDDTGRSDTATVVVTVGDAPPDEGDPEANDDAFTVAGDSADNSLDVLANDTDPDGDAITVAGVGAPANGTATVAADGSEVIYTPTPGFVGTDTFSYTVVDINGQTDTATVTVTVEDPSSPPPPPPPPPLTTSPIAFVAGGGSDGVVTVFGSNEDGTSFEQATIQPLGDLDIEVRVATTDLNGDGVQDILTAAGPGGAPRVVATSGSDGTVLRDFLAFEPTFTGGVYIAAADFNGDGFGDFVVGADLGGGSRVRVFSGQDNSVIGDFFAYETTFTGGVRVGIGDYNSDGVADIITGAGFLGGPRVTVFDGNDTTGGTRLADFFAFEQSQRDGVYVAGGDVNNDGFDDLVIGAGPNGGPRVTVFNGSTGVNIQTRPEELFNFFAFAPASRPGVRVAASDVNGDGLDDLIVGQGPLEGNRVRTFDTGNFGDDGQPLLIDDFFLSGDIASVTGVYVG